MITIANNFDFVMGEKGHRGNNAVLSYKAKGKTYSARVRVSEVGYTYGVSSDESHARVFRAFYPHRRAFGQFALTIDCHNYHEFRSLMNWLRAYSETLLTGAVSTRRVVTTMEVQVPSRRFHRLGILTTGIQDDDHVGAMVWSPTLVLQTVLDYTDPNSQLVRLSNASRFHLPKNGGNDATVFFPASNARYTDSSIYDNPAPIHEPGYPPTLPPGRF